MVMQGRHAEDAAAAKLVRADLQDHGERLEDNTSASKLTYQNMEILYGEFRTEVEISWSIDEAAIEAQYDRGILSITLPKAIQRRIPIVARQ